MKIAINKSNITMFVAILLNLIIILVGEYLNIGKDIIKDSCLLLVSFFILDELIEINKKLKL